MADATTDATTQTEATIDDEPKGKVDLAAVLYIIGGVPSLVAFLVILFALTRSCEGIPA
jgi:hypothetical protein